mgnify:FL=1
MRSFLVVLRYITKYCWLWESKASKPSTITIVRDMYTFIEYLKRFSEVFQVPHTCRVPK